MACYHPLTAWQTDDGAIVFSERGAIRRELSLPCGQCIGCRLQRSREWAIRCMHESQMHVKNSFVTLTYSDEHLPLGASLDYSEFQRFMRRLRARMGSARFFMCGEYGDDGARPHYHACLFGQDFSEDREFWRNLPSGSRIYRSKVLEELWPFGYSSIGDVTFESAAYVGRYCLKKVTGPRAAIHYREFPDYATGELREVVPEFSHSSLKPGIGATWLAKFSDDVYAHDGNVVRKGGAAFRAPRFYDKVFSRVDGFQFEYIQHLRELKGRAFSSENTRARLRAREIVQKAQLSFLKRKV